jgi:hypothetical protein
VSDTKYEDLFRDTYGHTLGSAMLPAIDAVAAAAKADERAKLLDWLSDVLQGDEFDADRLWSDITRMRQEAVH